LALNFSALTDEVDVKEVVRIVKVDFRQLLTALRVLRIFDQPREFSRLVRRIERLN